MGADWKTRLESCRNAMEALEDAEDEVGRMYRLEDRVGLLQAERDWNERRVEAMNRCRLVFIALEDAHASSEKLFKDRLREIEEASRPPVRPFNAEITVALVIVGIFLACLVRFGVW